MRVHSLRRVRSISTVLFLLFAFASPIRAMPESARREVQRHGYVFEKWVRDSFFEGAVAPYTSNWDVASSANKAHGELPISIKTARWGSAVDFGDARRQFAISQPFLCIIGFWQQREKHKYIVKVLAFQIEPKSWHELWIPIKKSDLDELDKTVKDRGLTFAEARKRAQEIKQAEPFSLAQMHVAPKIGSKQQRRVQCSLGFKQILKLAHAEPIPEIVPSLWGVDFPNPIESPPRVRKTK